MEKNIYIIRHCKAEGQPPEASLTEKGFKEAQHLKEFFSEKDIDRIVSSPFLRALQTVEPISYAKNIAIETDDRLSERRLSTAHLPDWQEKLKATFLDMALTYEGGESSQQATRRAVEVVEGLLEGESKNIILVTHGNLMALIIKHFQNDFGFEQWQNLSNPDVFLLKIDKEKTNLERLWDEDN